MALRIALVIILILVAFSGVLVVNTLTFTGEETEIASVEPVKVPSVAVDRFRKALQYPTISYMDVEKLDTSAFLGFHRYLAEAYPQVDSTLRKEVFNYSLLYTWEGSDPTLPGIVMMGHLDVVPVDESTLDKWSAGPFSGALIDGHIVGRGSMDDKVNVISCMETIDLLLTEGFQPKQTLYFSFGHDEEVGGDNGARVIADHLGNSGKKIGFVIDEGGYITKEGMFPGLGKQIAFINTAEKGFVSYRLTINTPGGHSSAPPSDNTIGSLAQAIVKLEENQFPYQMIPLLEKQIESIGPHFNSFFTRMAFANTWLLGGPILEGFNARTTTVATMIDGGVKDNVIPTEASVVVNFRIMPGQSVEDVHRHIIETVGDERISIESVSVMNEPSPVSDDGSASFALISETIRQLYPGVVVTPGLLGGGTDSKHFVPYSRNVYRFAPVVIGPESMGRFHGNDEKISVENFHKVIQFNYLLIKNAQEDL